MAYSRRPVIRIDIVTEEVREYPSVHSAIKDGFDKTAVSRCAQGRRFHHNGFIWMFKEDLDKLSKEDDSANEQEKVTEAGISP